MAYINVDPITKKIQEYKNMAEWQAAVEKATSDPKPKPIKKMTFAEASKKLREEAGIDLRDPAERQQEKIDAVIEQKVAEGLSAALARNQATQSPAASTQSHSPQAKQEAHASHIDRANAAMGRIYEMQKSLGLIPAKGCGCTKKAEPAVHSKESKNVAYGTGPVMACQMVTWPEAQKRLRAAGVEI